MGAEVVFGSYGYERGAVDFPRFCIAHQMERLLGMFKKDWEFWGLHFRGFVLFLP